MFLRKNNVMDGVPSIGDGLVGDDDPSPEFLAERVLNGFLRLSPVSRDVRNNSSGNFRIFC